MEAKLIPFLILAWLGAVQTNAQQVVDGPYVRYQGNQIMVTTIVKDDDLLQPETKVYADSDRTRIPLQVIPEGHPEWRFSVQLKTHLNNDPSTYPASGQTLFISDIEGEFAPFRKMLLAAKVIDTACHWTYGKGALVIPGDLFDRGKDVVPELWLLYKLEDEAKAAGGSVQVILGNHDIMNLSGDHRYTDAKYFKNAWLLGTDCAGLFGKDTELGRWLRSKNVIEKCGNVLIMHGGLSPAISKLGLSLVQLNSICKLYYGIPQKEIPKAMDLFFGNDALFWYRGYFMTPKATKGLVDTNLRFYDCKYILVGHTILKRNIASYFGGKIIGVDVDEHAGNTQAAFFLHNRWYVMDAEGKVRPLIYKPANDKIKDDDIL